MQQTFPAVEKSRDLYGVDLSFMVYFNLAKAYLKINSLPGVELYLDVIHRKYFKTRQQQLQKNAEDLIKSKYYSLLGFYYLKQGKHNVLNEVQGYFSRAETHAANASPFVLTNHEQDVAKSNVNSVCSGKSIEKESESLAATVWEDVELADGRSIQLAYPSGFFVGGMFDLSSQQKSRKNTLNFAGNPTIVWK